MRTARLLLALLLLLPTVTGCTVLKPVSCGILVPASTVAERLDRDDDDEDHNDLPAFLMIGIAPILIPLNYAYWTAHSVVAGTVSGATSDVLLLFGQANLETTFDTFLRPLKTNALKPDDGS